MIMLSTAEMFTWHMSMLYDTRITEWENKREELIYRVFERFYLYLELPLKFQVEHFKIL